MKRNPTEIWKVTIFARTVDKLFRNAGGPFLTYSWVVFRTHKWFCGRKTTEKYKGVETLLLNLPEIPDHIIICWHLRPWHFSFWPKGNFKLIMHWWSATILPSPTLESSCATNGQHHSGEWMWGVRFLGSALPLYIAMFVNKFGLEKINATSIDNMLAPGSCTLQKKHM
jgi:hypothetical protein